MTSLEQLLSIWQSDEKIHANIVNWQTREEVLPIFQPYPKDIDETLIHVLIQSGYSQLYLHQRLAYEKIRDGKNIVVVTGTSSGKTLCYNLSILNEIQKKHERINALYLFPTKALAADQYENLEKLMLDLHQLNKKSSENQAKALIKPYRYDGDTPQSQRKMIRQNARLLLTNPDMLHLGILPHHTSWAEYFHDLRYIVIDEMHIYRGVFGSHMANVIRRLKRICNFYGAAPQFLLTSATIGNPEEHGSHLIGENVVVIDEDGAPKGKRHFLLYNPPVINRDLGLRVGATTEAVRIASDLFTYRVQTLIFGRARRSIEIALRYLKSQLPQGKETIRGYRSGYLPKERRQIEMELRQGNAAIVVATNALELGVDIGGMQAVILIGYPGSIAATFQQAGRAGRKSDSGSSLAVLIATSGPIDQFLMKNPQYLFNRSTEKALIDPDNLLILFNHLKCAAFELPFKAGEKFGNLDSHFLFSMLEIIEQNGMLHSAKDGYYWIGKQYPSSEISLRNAGDGQILLQDTGEQDQKIIGQVDTESAVWMVHPGAIYLHDGRSFYVDELDLETKIAFVEEADLDYYTEPQFKITIENLAPQIEEETESCFKRFGEIEVVSKVIGFKKIRWNTREVLDMQPLDMPPMTLNTTAYWIELKESTIDSLKDAGLWNNIPNDYGPLWSRQRDLARARDMYRCQVCGLPESPRLQHHVHHKYPFKSFSNSIEANKLQNLVTLCPACHRRVETTVRVKSGLAGLSYLLHQFSPFFIMCDASDLGVFYDLQLPGFMEQPFVILYDQVPGGAGLSRAVFDVHHELMQNSLSLVRDCECQDGCPGCVGPGGENGMGGKKETEALLLRLAGEGM